MPILHSAQKDPPTDLSPDSGVGGERSFRAEKWVVNSGPCSGHLWAQSRGGRWSTPPPHSSVGKGLVAFHFHFKLSAQLKDIFLMERHSWLSSSSKVSCWFFLFLLGSFSWLLIIEYQSFQVLALNTVNFGWQFIYSHLQNIRQEATKEGRADLGSRREELILVHMSSMRCRLCCSSWSHHVPRN